MRSVRLTVAAVIGAAAALTGPAALANPAPPVDVFHAGSASPTNIYVAKGGHAEIRVNKATQAKLAKYGATITPLAPWTSIPGEPANAGIFMPVGEKYDSFQSDGRITYPGGLVITFPDSSGAKHTFSMNGTSLSLFPGIAGFYANPWVDGTQPLGKNTRWLGASFTEALLPGGFFAYHPKEDSWGPTNVTLTAAPALASVFRSYDIPIADFEPVAAITVRWNQRPEWADQATGR